RILVKRLLEARGYKVQAASNGAEAWQLYEHAPDAFDLVLTDMVMAGGVSGRQLAERLLSLRPRTKVIFMSGYSGDDAGGVELREGDNFLQKPFTPASLFECVRARLDEATARSSR